MSKKNILVQLDSDPHASVFDSVVAVDADVDQLLLHHGVTPEAIRDLTYGAMFTRGPDDLRHTAIFIGGSNVAAGEALLSKVTECFFGPMRVSVMLDSNGANTTAAAAVLAAAAHLNLSGTNALVLASTGPVGRRVVRLLAAAGAQVRAASRSVERAQEVVDDVTAAVEGAQVEAHESSTPAGCKAALDGVNLVIAAGAPGIELLTAEQRLGCGSLQVAIDLSAVAPAGLAGIEIGDKAETRDGVICYGAIGVGGTKMKIHKAAIRKLFSANNQVFDAEQIFAIGQQM